MGVWIRAARIAVLALLAGCATNPMTGRSQLMLVSEQSAIAQSVSAYDRMLGELRQKGKISTDPALVGRIHDITNRLIAQAIRYRPETRDWSWSIEVIDEPKTVNAFCMAGGKMAIYTGLIENIQPTDDELAQVIGHEIAHALASHSAEKMSVAMAANLAVAVTAAAAGRNSSERRGLYNAGALAAMAIITLPNSRQAEAEADKLGIELAARAGYEPEAAVTLWRKMMAHSKNSSRGDFFSTHPSAPSRIDELSRLVGPMREMHAAGQASRAAPAYAWLGRSRNERVVGERPPQAGEEQALAFYSPAFDAFRKGEAALRCAGECSAAFLLKQSALKSEFDRRNWRVLAAETMKTDYRLDLGYLYLAKAAEGMGYEQAARTYFQEARRLAGSNEFACARRTFIGCAGLDVPGLAEAALAAREGDLAALPTATD